jgi:arylsulfatase A-like enzyme|tara:strand:+ start:1688 stop:4009 length:2322 start_codon:yes stop_codon:yes gene_type:complete
MKKFFLLIAFFEILAGIVLFFAADKIPQFNNASQLTLGFAKMYGVAAFSLGLFALYIWNFFNLNNLHKPFLIIFSIFNIGIAYSVIQSNLSSGFETPAPGFFHLVLGCIGIYFIIKKKSLANNFSKLLLYLFAIITTALITTNYVLFALPTTVSDKSFFRIILLFIILVFPGLYYINKVANKKLKGSIKKILFISISGSILAWIIQLIEIHLYHFEIGVDSPIGFFEDEFTRTWKYFLPTLLLSELIWFYLKNKLKLVYTGFSIIIIFSFISFYNSFVFSDSNPAVYTDLSLNKTVSPNVILIVADDLGYNDISYNGNTLIETKNIDQIAKNGINFSRAYATASVCAPSRAAFLTGNYQQRYGFEFLPDLFNYSPRVRKADFKRFGHQDNFKKWYENDTPINKRGLNPFVNTIGDYLKKMGYQTSVIGKWHMGTNSKFNATNFGFDFHYGISGAGSLYAPINQDNIIESRHTWDFADFIIWQATNYHTLENGKKTIPKNSEYLTDVFTKRAVDYIKVNKNKPFFLHLSHMAPHGPFQAQKKYYDQFSHIKDHNKRVYYAMIKNLDDSIGEIKKALNDEGIAENTLIIFTSDNGGATYTRATDNSPFIGGKMSNFEGGTTVPMIIEWTNKIKPQGNYSNMVSLLDIVPTILDAVKSPSLSNTFDGVSLLPYIKSKDKKPHKELFWKTGYVKSIISDNFKLHINEKENFRTLINLENDPSEKFNLISKYPEKAKKLTESWEQWNNTLKEPIWKSNADVSIPISNSENSKKYYFPW